VEQKAGWSAIPAAFPTFFQIRDVSRRAIEFLMNLETHSLELTRQRLQIEIATVKSAWRVQRDALLSVAASVNGAVESVPTEPVATPQDLNRAHLRVPLVDRWLAIAEMAEDLRKRIDELVTGETALVGPEASSQADQIAVLTEQVSEHNRRRNEIFRAKVREQMQRSSLEYRQQSLDEDLQKNLDAQKLRNFGSVISDAVAPDHCPTCAQPLADTLDAQKPGLDVMPVEANIEYIKAQRDIFRRLRERNESALHEFDRQLAAATAELNDAAARLRAVKADLVAPAQAPSVAAIDERIRAEVKLQAILEASDKFDEQIVLLTELSGRFAQLLAAQDALPLERLSNADKDKIQLFERLIQSQLSAYGFTTFAAEELNISEDSYRPQKEGFEIGFELSASDAIRLKWSYQLALLELSGSKKTNHPGVVVFDEPRQQETAKISFKRLLERAADSKRMGHQVIFATSEDRDELERFVDGLDCHFIAFEGYLIQRIQ
jgi:hypothetical protein